MKLIDCTNLPAEESKPRVHKQFTLGRYKTEVHGVPVVLARLRQLGMIWVLDGAYFHPDQKTWNFCSWNLDGTHSECAHLNLKADE